MRILIFWIVWLVLLLVCIQLAQSRSRPRLSRTFSHPAERNEPSLRIIGGQEATPHAYPYQVGIYVKKASGTSFCGGSLVSSNYVLTAAHCAEKAQSMALIFGAHNITVQESTQVRLTSTNFIIHPQWDSETLLNDVALVKLPSPVKETDYIKIIKITNSKTDFSGTTGLVAGWGKTKNTQKGVTPILRYIISKIMTNDDCKKTDESYNEVIKPSLLCLSGAGSTGHIGSCEGDSGGPLVVDGVQVGLVAFGDNDCEAGNPSVFTRLSEFRDWIVANSDVTL